MPLPYTATFTADEYSRLCEGLKSRSMDDKWVVVFNKPNLDFRRSWTALHVYRVVLEGGHHGATVRRALWSSSLHAQSPSETEYQAELLTFLVSNLLLGRSTPFPTPPGLDSKRSSLLQHSVSGTGFPAKVSSASFTSPSGTSVARTTRPWWRFWR
jgi:hypothetical protein